MAASENDSHCCRFNYKSSHPPRTPSHTKKSIPAAPDPNGLILHYSPLQGGTGDDDTITNRDICISVSLSVMNVAPHVLSLARASHNIIHGYHPTTSSPCHLAVGVSFVSSRPVEAMEVQAKEQAKK